jgi:hypothetical protein
MMSGRIGKTIRLANTYFNFNVYDEDWNYIADIGGNTRVVTDPETGL